jgi:SH3-like domain-containing protein
MTRKLNTRHTLISVFLILYSGVSLAAPYDDAVVAYENEDYSTAYGIWSRLSDQNDASSQFAIGVMFSTGIGQQKDTKKAFEWFSKAAESGHVAAMYNLGIAYWTGQGTAEDFAEGLHWWRKAAERGDRVSQYNVGIAYYNGNNVPQNLSEAARWIRASADQDYSLANAFLPQLEKKLRESTPAIAATDSGNSNNSSKANTTEPSEAVTPIVVSEKSSESTSNPSISDNSESSQIVTNAGFTAAIVKSANSPVYADKSKSTPVIEKLASGAPVKVLVRGDTWTKIQIATGFRVWVYGKYIRGEGQNAQVSGQGVRVRPLPSTAENSPPLGILDNKTAVTLLKTEGKWKFIQAPSSMGAWVLTKDLAIQENPTVAWMNRWDDSNNQ